MTSEDIGSIDGLDDAGNAIEGAVSFTTVMHVGRSFCFKIHTQIHWAFSLNATQEVHHGLVNLVK